MATPAETRAAIDDTLHDIATSGGVKSYTLESGQSIQLLTPAELLDLRDRIRILEQEDAGVSAFHKARLRPR